MANFSSYLAALAFFSFAIRRIYDNDKKPRDWVTKKSARELIEKRVAEGSNMVSDGYAMYAFLGQDDRFKHYIVDHKAGQYVNSGFHTNGSKNFWSLLKRGILKFA